VYLKTVLFLKPMASFQNKNDCLNKKKSCARRYQRKGTERWNYIIVSELNNSKFHNFFLDSLFLHFLTFETECVVFQFLMSIVDHESISETYRLFVGLNFQIILNLFSKTKVPDLMQLSLLTENVMLQKGQYEISKTCAHSKLIFTSKRFIF